MRSEPSLARSRTRGQRTATGPMPVMISRSGRCPWRTSRWRHGWRARLRLRPPPLAPAALARRCAESRSAGPQKFLAGRAGIERHERVLLGLRHPDLLQCPLGFRLLALRQLVQHIGGLVHPATLAAGLGPHFLNRLPEAECAVGNCELGADGKPTPFEVEE